MPNAITNVRSNSNSSGVATRCTSCGSRPDIRRMRCTSTLLPGGCDSTSLMTCRVCPASAALSRLDR
jgi:hypothetical protein